MRSISELEVSLLICTDEFKGGNVAQYSFQMANFFVLINTTDAKVNNTAALDKVTVNLEMNLQQVSFQQFVSSIFYTLISYIVSFFV